MFARWYYYASAYFILQSMEALGIIDRTFYNEWVGKPGDKITATLTLSLMATAALLFARGYRWFGQVRTGAYLAFGLVGLFLTSSLWATDASTTIRYSVLYAFMVMGSIGIATNLKSDEYMELLALMCFLCAVASVLLYLAVPSMAYGGPDSTGDFRGIFSQKNILGEAMTIGALACLHGLRVNRRRRNRNLVFLGVVAVLAIMSGSATSSVTVVIFCLVHVAGEMIRKGGAARPLAIMVLVLAMPVILFAAAAPDTLMEMIGKDPTLTGRTEIWAYVIEDIYRKPLLGWGYLGFWTFDNPAAVEISNALHWFAPQSHNGLLEILLYVGFIGAAYFIFLWARLVWLAVRCLPTPDYAAGMSCLLSCIGVLLVGISETVLVVPFEASTSVFFITGFLCERASRTARVRRRRPARVDASRAGRPLRVPAMRAATASARRVLRPGGVR